MTADAEAVPSPCVSVCVMDASGGFCTGCYRTLAEIAAWQESSPAEKRVIAARAAERRARAGATQ